LELYPLPGCKISGAILKRVPTKVLLERCLSLTSNMQVETPKSASFTIPLLSSSMIPGCNPYEYVIVDEDN
ncbi:hypothetical protein ES319_A06G108600v1, partial [Gossypium barbadense]